MAGLTGKRWPIVGKRLHMEFPYIDAEVSGMQHFKSEAVLYMYMIAWSLLNG